MTGQEVGKRLSNRACLSLSPSRSRTPSRRGLDHVEVSHGCFPIDKKPVVFRIEHRSLHRIPGKVPDGVERIPERERDELGPLSLTPAE